MGLLLLAHLDQVSCHNILPVHLMLAKVFTEQEHLPVVDLIVIPAGAQRTDGCRSQPTHLPCTTNKAHTVPFPLSCMVTSQMYQQQAAQTTSLVHPALPLLGAANASLPASTSTPIIAASCPHHEPHTHQGTAATASWFNCSAPVPLHIIIALLDGIHCQHKHQGCHCCEE